MRLLRVLSPVFYFLLLASCDFVDNRLIINNKSSRNIYVAFSEDSILSLNGNKTLMMSDEFIKAISKKNIINNEGTKGWETQIERGLNKQLHVFILLEDTLKKYDPNDIIKLKKFEKRIDIRAKELEASNWEIIYEN